MREYLILMSVTDKRCEGISDSEVSDLSPAILTRDSVPVPLSHSRLTGISYGVIQRINSKMKVGQ